MEITVMLGEENLTVRHKAQINKEYVAHYYNQGIRCYQETRRLLQQGDRRDVRDHGRKGTDDAMA